MAEAQALRAAILAAPLETSNFGEIPYAGVLYVPPSHLKALRLDAHVVVGGRGVGKSFWTAVLQKEALRKLLGSAAAELAGVHVRLGFANAENIAHYPRCRPFRSLPRHRRRPVRLVARRGFTLGRGNVRAGDSPPELARDGCVAQVQA
ncbi:MAG: hypothetical protein RML12_04460 [Xanthomonadales bacterium]|nr:hypothetical protein [Xanthomonadales bacterium]